MLGLPVTWVGDEVMVTTLRECNQNTRDQEFTYNNLITVNY